MKIVTAAEMREIDRATSEGFGVASLSLMENAGTAVANFVASQFLSAECITVVVAGSTAGRFSAAIPGWLYGDAGSIMVTEQIEDGA